ncbi:hypothetical protein B5M42_021255 [Paenibacillus athensensis]|uniref:Uncharacterized protein n=1 Tax=Paenibacillus athensensis TaxID=1967502 RepID=A0A4Y8PZM8_9BACL|nr:hypothetical protein [Paenibacillus athensensis]MCD1261332.1 hypothetical protein [Paenibacillus athensensis]
MYFTQGKRRRYERLMQTRPGFDRDEPLQDEAEKPHKRNGSAHEAGQSTRGQGTNKQGNNNYPKKEK